MFRILFSVLNSINEGVVILNENLEIVFWNNYMEYLTGINKKNAINNNVYNILTRLDKGYFKVAIDSTIKDGRKMFFSAAMHKNLVNDKQRLNLKISKIDNGNLSAVLLEFIDVTNQFERIDQLKNYIDELHILNEELKEKEKTINRLAYYDGLTELPNRTLFYKISDKFLSEARRKKSLLGLLFIDVDKFKNINDTYGHKRGDEVIIQVSKILSSSIRESDTICRFGGDEFVILLPYIKNYDDCKEIVSRIMSEKDKVIKDEKDSINIGLSIGVSFYPKDASNIDELISKADKAMYVAKSKGGNNHYFSK